MDNRYHQTTTYMPKIGRFYKGDTSMMPSQALLATSNELALLSQYGDKVSLTANSGIQIAARVAQRGVMTAAADPANLSHLQQIQLIRKPIGEPQKYFAAEKLFATLNVDMLEAREPIQSTFGNQGYLDPLQETRANEAKYAEIAYNLKKLPLKVYTPIEDIMRTVINPQTITYNTAKWDLDRRRNMMAIRALATIEENDNLSQIDAIGPDAFHSTNQTATEIADIINEHLTDNASLITHIGMNTADFSRYTSNTWTNAGPTNMQINRVIGAGEAPFPGIDGLTAVIDPMIPRNTAYLIDKINGARLAEGPKIMRRYYDEEKDAEVIKMLDFNQFIVVQPNAEEVNRKFVRKITFAPTPP